MAGILASSEEQRRVNQCIKQITGDLADLLMADQPLQWMLRPVYSQSRFLPRIKPLAKSVAFNFSYYTITHKNIKRAIDQRLEEYNVPNTPTMVKMIQFIPYAIQMNITGMDNRWIIQVETEEAWRALIRYGLRINEKVLSVRDYITIQRAEIEVWKILNDKEHEPTRYITPGSSVGKTSTDFGRRSKFSKTPKSLSVNSRNTSQRSPSPYNRRGSEARSVAEPVTAVEEAAIESSISSPELENERTLLANTSELWLQKYVTKWLSKLQSKRRFTVKFKVDNNTNSKSQHKKHTNASTSSLRNQTEQRESKRTSFSMATRKVSFGSLACAVFKTDDIHSEDEEEMEDNDDQLSSDPPSEKGEEESDSSADTYQEDPYDWIKKHRKGSYSSCSSVDSPPPHRLLMPQRKVNYRRAFDITYRKPVKD